MAKIDKSVLVPALSAFQFGYNTSVIAGSLVFVTEAFFLTSLQEGLAAAMMLLGALVTSSFSGILANRIGRKNSLFFCAFLFFLGSLVSGVSLTYSFFLIGRFLIGLGAGIATIVAPIYLVEIAPPQDRGSIMAFYQVAIAVGALVAYLMNYLLAPTENWRWMFVLGIFPAILQILGLFFIPESFSQQVQGPSFKELLQPSYRSLIGIASALFILQALAGANAVFYFAPRIFQSIKALGDAGPFTITAWIGVVYALATICSFWLIDQFGRRTLLLFSFLMMAVSLFSVAIAFWTEFRFSHQVVVVAILSHIIFYTIGAGPIPPLVTGEIAPESFRGHLMTIAGFAGWVVNYLSTLTFLPLLRVLSLPSTFLLYAIFCLLSFLFVYKKVPETRRVFEK